MNWCSEGTDCPLGPHFLAERSTAQTRGAHDSALRKADPRTDA
jgi:hypothetical protein